MSESLQAEVVAWARETFPEAMPITSLAHLHRELNTEFVAALCSEDREDIAEEAADIVLLLMNITGRWYGVDLLAAVREKFEINKGRTWGPPDADGVREHIRTREGS